MFLWAGSLIFPPCSGPCVLGRQSLWCVLLESRPPPPSGKPSHGARNLYRLSSFKNKSVDPDSIHETMKRHVLVTWLFLHRIINRELVTSRHTQVPREGLFHLYKCDSGKVFPFLSTQILKSCSNLKYPHILKCDCPEKVTCIFALLVIILVIRNHGVLGSCHTLTDLFVGMRPCPGVPVSSQTEQEK